MNVSSGAKFFLLCDGFEACNSVTLHCGHGTECYVSCDGEKACNSIDLNGSGMRHYCCSNHSCNSVSGGSEDEPPSCPTTCDDVFN